jgi:polar amino acid transport system substrate-binding protein
MTIGLFALVAALASAAVPGARAADPKLIESRKLMAATEGVYPSFSMRAPGGQFDGREIRVVKKVAGRIGLTYVPMITKWVRS